MVWDLDADSALYTYHHRHRMRPASTMKLITSITALDLYGGDHGFTTEIHYNGQLKGHTLVGDILCVGGMDPAFDSGDLRLIVDRVRLAGIDTICGRVIADKSMKDDLLLGEGWCWDDDNPCLSALLVARKDNFTERLHKELTNVGIVVGDSVMPKAKGDAGGFKITHSMKQILKRMMKQSDNLYAESMFYHAALSLGRPATVKNARSAVKQLIKRLGLDPSNYYIADGSGLSLYNYVSPELLTAFLRHAYQNERIREYLLPSLPVAGVDGTLKSRMKDTAACGNVQAKTGTVEGISALAGYCTAPNGHRLCFAIINQGVAKSKDGRAFQDIVCTILTTPVENEESTAP